MTDNCFTIWEAIKIKMLLNAWRRRKIMIRKESFVSGKSGKKTFNRSTAKFIGYNIEYGFVELINI